MERTLWWMALALIVVTFADAFWLTMPRRGQRYIRSAGRTRLLLALVEVTLLAAAALLHRIPLTAGDPAPFRWTGGAIALAGAAFAAWGKIRLGRLFTGNLGVKENHSLVTDGPYGVVRHPIYLGMIVFFIGTGLAWNAVSYVALGIAVIPCLAAQIATEDRIFAQHFGAPFEEYRGHVPALLPWPRPRTRK